MRTVMSNKPRPLRHTFFPLTAILSFTIACWIEYTFDSNTVGPAASIKQYQKCVTAENGTDMLSRNVSNQLPT
jgi:hypothetical protein